MEVLLSLVQKTTTLGNVVSYLFNNPKTLAIVP